VGIIRRRRDILMLTLVIFDITVLQMRASYIRPANFFVLKKAVPVKAGRSD
jgi:hypothetical protein